VFVHGKGLGQTFDLGQNILENAWVWCRKFRQAHPTTSAWALLGIADRIDEAHKRNDLSKQIREF